VLRLQWSCCLQRATAAPDPCRLRERLRSVPAIVSEFRETALPCSRETIVACVSHLCRTPALARRTILTRIAAINAAHLDAGLPLPAAGAARKQLNLIVAHQRPGAPTPSLPARRTKQDLGGGRDKSP
jgi:hypothetical protein